MARAKSVTTVTFALGAALALTAPASASDEPVLLLPSTGYYLDVGEPYVGLAVEFPIGNGWRLSPDAEYVFVDEGDLYSFSVDFIYDFETDGPFTFWAGAGPAYVVADYENDGERVDDSDVALDVLGGVAFHAGRIEPFVQVKFSLADETETVLSGGIRF